MMDSPSSRMERIILAFDAPPVDMLYRALVGYVVMPFYEWLGDGAHTMWGLLGALLVVLAGSRIAPMIVRRLLPFSAAVKTVWAERRQLAKHVDSYQWRKMLGVGLGWAIWCLQTRTPIVAAPFVAALACMAAGIAGWIFWWGRATRHKVPTDQPAQVH
ncbi:MAG TPA: hypothetical protein VFZ95_09870 [Steroidobacteraceae bacterium]